MDFGIRGKTALVTASSRGMGNNIARALAEEGCNIMLFARSAELLRASAMRLEEDFGVNALAVAGSMNDAADIERLAAGIGEKFGSLDIAVFNTGRPPLPQRSAIDETDPQRWHTAYETLLSGVIGVVNKILPLMKSGGRLVAITSSSVRRPMPHHALSSVFRAGIEAYFRHLSVELGPRGITANCVAPALIETPHRPRAESYSEAETEKRKSMNALRRLGTQAELCALVTFLASQQAGFITGESIHLDGGLMPPLETN